MDNYSKFKHLLEYFVAHLEWVENQDKNHIGYKTYIQPIHKFKSSGQGWKDDSIQNQISQWDTYNNNDKACINIYAANYQSKACYLNWRGSWYNVRPNWGNNHIIELYLSKDEKPSAKSILTQSIEKLGLFDNQPSNTCLKNFFDEFLYMKLNIPSEVKDSIELLKHNYNLILTGAPGTGKTYLALQIANAMGATKENGCCKMIQFHPSYDYTDFIEGLRPTRPDSQGNIGFELKDGIFKSFCLEAKKNLLDSQKSQKGISASSTTTNKVERKNYVFIIDEINRGEISKIFGELFFSIDPGYRGKSGAVQTQYANMHDTDEMFYIPENVYIIGTMNDIDRSVDSFDFAMRRRFVWKEISAESSLENMGLSDEIKKKATQLNHEISKIEGLNSSYHIGGAYFLKRDGEDQIDLDKIWRLRLEPLLKEYLRGMDDAEENLQKLKTTYDA